MMNRNVYKVDAHILRVFLKVCELQSMSRAAEYFDLNQSTVSNMMDRLRNLVGFKLFEKVGRNIVPSENAKALIPRATEIVSAIEGLLDTGEYDPSQDRRPVTIMSNLNSTTGVLESIRNAIWARAPEQHIRFLELGSRDRLEDQFNQSSVDFCISVRPPKYPPSLMSKLLFQDRSVVFYDQRMRECPLTRRDYFSARHGVLDFGGHSRSAIEHEVRSHQAHRHIAFSASDANVLAQMIKGTDIIASQPSHLRHYAFRDFAWGPLPLTPNTILNFDLVWHRRNAESSRHRWLLETISMADAQSAARAKLD